MDSLIYWIIVFFSNVPNEHGRSFVTFPNVLVIKLIGNVPEVTRKAAIEFGGMLMPSSGIIMIL